MGHPKGKAEIIEMRPLKWSREGNGSWIWKASGAVGMVEGFAKHFGGNTSKIWYWNGCRV